MKKCILSIQLAMWCVLSSAISVHAQSWDWMRGAHNGTSLGNMVTTDASGNVYCAGSVWGTGTIGPFPFASGFWGDMPVIKYDSAGNIAWMTLGYPKSASKGITADLFGNIYVLGHYWDTFMHFGGHTITSPHPDSSCGFIAKLNSSGSVIWLKNVGNNNAHLAGAAGRGNCITTDSAGNIYFACEFNGNQTYGGYSFYSAGERDILVAKCDPFGTVIWAKQYGGIKSEYLSGIGLTPSGKIYISGTYQSPTLAFGSTVLIGSFPAPSSCNAFITLLDASGYAIWAKSSGGDVTCLDYGIATDAWGNAFVTGGYHSGFPPSYTASFDTVVLPIVPPLLIYGFLVKYDSVGNVCWGKSIKGKSVRSHGVTVDPCNNPWIFGMNLTGIPNEVIKDTIDGHILAAPPINYQPTFIASWTNSGTYQLASALYGGGNYRAGEIASENCTGNIYITSVTEIDTFIVAGDSLFNSTTSGVTYNLFLAKFYPGLGCGNCTTPPDNILCVGASVTLTPSLPMGGIWTSSAPIIASVGATSGLIAALSAGTATITYTFGSSTNLFLIKVNPLPTAYSVTGGGYYCVDSPGVHIGLSGSGDACTTYQLYNGTTLVGLPNIGTGSAIDFGLITAAGTYSAMAINTCTGCASNMVDSATVNIYPGPDAGAITGIDSVCVGDTVTLHNSIAGGVWLSEDLTIATVTSTGVVTGIAPGIDTIRYTVSGTPCSTSTIFLIKIKPDTECITGVHSVNAANVAIMPNPAGSELTVSLGNITGQVATITISDVLGRVLFRQRLQGNATSISLSSIPTGVYYCKISIDAYEAIAKKLVIIK